MLTGDNGEERPLRTSEDTKYENNEHQQDTIDDCEDQSMVDTQRQEETSQNSINRLIAVRICKKNIVVPSLIFIGLIAVVVIIVSAVLGNKTQNNMGNMSAITGQNTNMDNKEHLIIDQNGPCSIDCINCTAEVLGPKNASVSQGKSCDASFEPNIKNSSCYQCGDQCITFESLSNGTTCGRPLDCCAYAIMGNLNKYCGQDGQYICKYSSDRPVCDCPAGKIGRTCNLTYTQQVSCKCYNSDRQFSNQEEMVECNSKDRTTNSSVCQIYQNIDNKRHNCICNQDKPTPKQDLCDSSIRNEKIH